MLNNLNLNDDFSIFFLGKVLKRLTEAEQAFQQGECFKEDKKGGREALVLKLVEGLMQLCEEYQIEV